MSLAEKLGERGKGEQKKEIFQSAPGEQWEQKFVLLQREEKGYGFRLTGSCPAQVQSVRENSAAARAGIAPRDKVFKVNGTLVTGMKHEDVVRLIDSNSHVQLVLLHQVTTGSAPSPVSASIPQPVAMQQAGKVSGPLAADNERARDFQQMKLNTLLTMFDQANAEYERIRAEVFRNPSNSALQAKLTEGTKMIEKLKREIDDMKATADERSSLVTSPPAAGVRRPQDDSQAQRSGTVSGSKHKKTPSLPDSAILMGADVGANVSRSQSDSRRKIEAGAAMHLTPISIGDSDGSTVTLRDRSQSMPYVAMTVKSRLLWALKGALSMGSERLDESGAGYSSDDQLDEVPSTTGAGNRSTPVFVPAQEVQIMSMEEEEEFAPDMREHRNSWQGAINEVGPAADQGPFSSFLQLLQKPAHLSVFLHYLFCNSDPAPLLFRLIIESYVRESPKEMKRWAYEIFSTFVVEGAPLQVSLQPFIVRDMDEVLLYKADKDDVMRNIFDQAKQYVERDLRDCLADYRNKSVMGLDSMYGGHELNKLTGDKQEEFNVALKFLWLNFERLIDIPKKADRDLALTWALGTVIKDMGLSALVTNAALLDRTPSFVCKDKKYKLARTNKKNLSLSDHQLTAQQFYALAACACCQKILWGIGCQGYQCSNCEINIHFECVVRLSEKCGGKGKKRDTKRMTTMLGKLSVPVARRTTGPSVSPSPGVGGTINYSQSKDADEELDEVRGLPRRPMYESGSGDAQDDDSYNISDDDIARANAAMYPGQSDLSRSTSTASDISRSTIASSINDSMVSLRSLEDDKDLEIESDMPPLENVIPKDILKKLKPKEKKRQEVINELFYTEANHVRNLRVLQKVFYQPMSKQKYPDRLLEFVFPNLDDVHRLHANLSNAFKEKRKENIVVGDIGDVLLAAFEGEAGLKFRTTMARFCGYQSHAGNLLRQRQRNDQKFAQFLQELNSNTLCRRLELKDLLPTIMQRLTKYPLLIENLLKYSQPEKQEYKNLQKALECSRNTLAFVNKEVRECENRQRLEDVYSRLDTSSMPKDFVMIDLRQRTLLHYGTLVWKINAQRLIDVHVLLLDTHIVILERRETRYVLRQQNVSIGGDQFLYSPIVDLPGMLVRPNAGDAKAFFLIKVIPAVKVQEEPGPKKKAHSQIYELIAGSKDEHKTWMKNVEAAVSAQPKSLVLTATRPTQSLPTVPSADSGTTTVASVEGVKPAKDVVGIMDNNVVGGVIDEEIADIVRQREDQDRAAALEQSKSSSSSTASIDMVAHVETYEVEPQLIQPSEVVVKDHVVVGSGAFGASGDLTSMERLRHEDESLARALHMKRKIIGEIFNVPESDYRELLEHASIDSGMDPLACLLEDSRQLTLLCSRAEVNSRRMALQSADDEEGASGNHSGEMAMRMCMEMDYESMVSLMERLNSHLLQLVDRQMTVAVSPSTRSYNNSARSRVLSSSDTASPVRMVPPSGESEASVSHKVTSVDRHDEVMHMESSRAEIRVRGRRQNSQWIAAESNDSHADVPRRAARGSYAMALESSPENLISDKTARSHQTIMLNEWTPDVETNQYEIVGDADANSSEVGTSPAVGTFVETDVPREFLKFELDNNTVNQNGELAGSEV